MQKFAVTIILALFIAVTLVVVPTRAAVGDLDRSFGGYGVGGRIISDAFPGTTINASVVTGDKLIVVGTNGLDMVITRYDQAGKLDPNFGTSGVTTLDFNNQTDTATAVALVVDNQQVVLKILVVGTTTFGSGLARNSDFAVARLNPDGTPDLAFSQDGKTTANFNNNNDRATDVVPWHNSNKILVAGSAEENPPGVNCGGGCNTNFGFALFNSDGTPDTNFGSGGLAQPDFVGSDAPLTVALDQNGGFYAGGVRNVGTTQQYVIARYTATGALNMSFDTDGRRIGSTPSLLTDLVFRRGDDTVVATGVVSGTVSRDFGLIRFKPDGDLVTDFGTEGLATVDLGGNDTPHTLYTFGDGSFAVAGSSIITQTNSLRLATARFTDKGQPVANSATTFELADAGAETVRAVALRLVPDVRLLTIGSVRIGVNAHLALVRHFLDGTADAGGRQATDLFLPEGGLQLSRDDQAKSAVFQADGKLLVAGTVSGNQTSIVLVRYTATGALDPTFDGDGKLILPTLTGYAAKLALQPDGKIVVAGTDFNVARLNPDGSPDTSFNGTGFAQVNTDGARSTGLTLQPDGKIVLAGNTNPLTFFILARFTTTGQPDPNFGFEGVARIGVGVRSGAADVVAQPDGKLVAAGATMISETDYNWALLRLNPDGTPDNTFDGDGKLTTDFGSVDVATTLALQPDGAMLVAGGSANNGAAFARYLPDGALDPTFDNDGKQNVQIIGNEVAQGLSISATGISAAICGNTPTSTSAGFVVRLTTDGKLDTSINGNGRLPFRFAEIECPRALAATPGRLAAVGYAAGKSFSTNFSKLATEDFAVAIYDNSVPPTPTATVIASATATDTSDATPVPSSTAPPNATATATGSAQATPSASAQPTQTTNPSGSRVYLPFVGK